jgi:hypothetical protein
MSVGLSSAQRIRRRGNGAKIIEGLEEAVRHARGEATDVRVTTYIVRKGIRKRADGVTEIFREAADVLQH